MFLSTLHDSPCTLIAPLGWAVVGSSLTAGVASLALVGYLQRYRDRPGTTWFMAALSAQALFALAYGTGLLVPVTPLRAGAEALAWAGLGAVGPLFFAFALEYTGRADPSRRRWLPVVLGLPVWSVLLVVSYPAHDLLWHGFRLEPVFGLATVQYAMGAVGHAIILTSVVFAGIGVLLLIDTVVSYGPLYRREAVAVALSPFPPILALFIWLTGVGPWPALNLTAAFFLPHVLLDAYAFTSTHMFDTNPVTQRVADRRALDVLRDPLLVVDSTDHVVRLNERAQALFDTTPETLPVSLDALTGFDSTELRAAETITLDGPGDRVYAVSCGPMSDSRGDTVGTVVAMYDITLERRQREQLSVLHRVMRHNLRNELSAIQLHTTSVQDRLTDTSLAAQLDDVVEASERMLDLSDDITEFDRLRTTETQREAVDLPALVAQLATGIRGQYTDAEVVVDAADATVRTDPAALGLALEHLVENAIVHADDSTPAVTLAVTVEAAAVRFEVRDHNDRIPAVELTALDAAEERPLEHGQGLGLAIVDWLVDGLGGALSFDYDDGNVVSIELPTDRP